MKPSNFNMRRDGTKFQPRLRVAQMIVVLLLAGLCGNCYLYQLQRDSAPKPADAQGAGSDPQEPIRIVVLVLAQPVAMTQGDLTDQRADWFPVELVIADPRFAILFNATSGSPSRTPAPEAALLDTLPNRLTAAWGPGKHANIQYRRYLNLAEYTADANQPGAANSGRLFIKLYRIESRPNISVLASCLTLLVIPSFSDEAVFTETVFVGPDNRAQDLSPVAGEGPLFRSWFGWIFFVWGPLISAAREELLFATVDARIKAASGQGIFVPASSRINL